MLVIAGLHMGMVAGLAFVALRAFLALVPALSLRYPTKKWAAGFALLVTFSYMLLSGATVSSRRSFVMTGLVMLAVLLDRLQLSARGLAYAATAILLLTPMSVTGPSFQMSFAAVGGLIAFYETYRGTLSRWHREAGPVGRIGLYALGISLTTVICTLATAPYTIFHFCSIRKRNQMLTNHSFHLKIDDFRCGRFALETASELRYPAGHGRWPFLQPSGAVIR